MGNKTKVAIIDDEKLAQDIVANYLKAHEDIEIIAKCSNGFEGIKIINEQKPDIVFLDIQMPKINGFEMLELLDETPVIIFSTAFDQYALKAFEVNATDYLLKPYSQERFNEALSKAIIQLKNKDKYNKNIQSLISHLDEKPEYLDRVVVKDKQKISIIPIDDIKYLEAQDDYVMLNTSHGKLLKQKTMKYFERHLNPKDFVRIHRSYIVKSDFIKQIELFEKESYRAILKDESKLPISKTGYDKLKNFFNQ
ncbi:MAG: DNA-binding response regulator [Ignavibacteria bacterium RBG_13_36_8]|nr:MAG: DNA-binding response regulator [Ignavibacteria bacterium RBG_13_36_8]